MQLGIFAKTFPGDIEANMAAVADAGMAAVQYNLSIAGLDTVPAEVDTAVLTKISNAAERYGITLAAISGTFNTAHPDPSVRRAGLERFPALAAAAAQLRIPIITLCSGSRDPQDMWRHHPDNDTAEAWQDSRASLERLAEIAEHTGVTLAVEPEHTNVVSTAELARKMLTEVGSDRLKIVFDAANLLDTADLREPTIRSVLARALDILGPDIVLAHAKELVVDRSAVAPGQGVLPWPYIIDQLSATGYGGTVVTHGLPAASVPVAVDTLAPLITKSVMMPRILRTDGASLEYERRPSVGQSSLVPFIFQHGMGGDRQQPLGYIRSALPGIDLVSMDARGHGGSSDIADPAQCSFDVFADDVIALANHLQIERFIMGGISLGAAVALNVAIRHPDRVSALLLCRPAWLDVPQADRNREAYALIADLLDTYEVPEALATFESTAIYQGIVAESPSAAQSLRHQITRPRAAINADILRRFPASTPAPDVEQWRLLTIPTLVIGHHDDPFHPWDIAETTQGSIPGATLVEIVSKDRDTHQFAVQTDTAILAFLNENRTAGHEEE